MAEALAGEEGRDLGEWHVGKIDLMRSVLSPQGASYTALKSIPLQNL